MRDLHQKQIPDKKTKAPASSQWPCFINLLKTFALSVRQITTLLVSNRYNINLTLQLSIINYQISKPLTKSCISL